MTTLRLSDSLLDGYVALFTQLESRDQTILLNKLTKSTNRDVLVRKKPGNDISKVVFLPKPPNAPSFEELCGAWQDDRSAEEIIEDLRCSRTTNLDRVNL